MEELIARLVPQWLIKCNDIAKKLTFFSIAVAIVYTILHGGNIDIMVAASLGVTLLCSAIPFYICSTISSRVIKYKREQSGEAYVVNPNDTEASLQLKAVLRIIGRLFVFLPILAGVIICEEAFVKGSISDENSVGVGGIILIAPLLFRLCFQFFSTANFFLSNKGGQVIISVLALIVGVFVILLSTGADSELVGLIALMLNILLVWPVIAINRMLAMFNLEAEYQYEKVISEMEYIQEANEDLELLLQQIEIKDAVETSIKEGYKKDVEEELGKELELTAQELIEAQNQEAFEEQSQVFVQEQPQVFVQEQPQVFVQEESYEEEDEEDEEDEISEFYANLREMLIEVNKSYIPKAVHGIVPLLNVLVALGAIGYFVFALFNNNFEYAAAIRGSMSIVSALGAGYLLILFALLRNFSYEMFSSRWSYVALALTPVGFCYSMFNLEAFNKIELSSVIYLCLFGFALIRFALTLKKSAQSQWLSRCKLALYFLLVTSFVAPYIVSVSDSMPLLSIIFVLVIASWVIVISCVQAIYNKFNIAKQMRFYDTLNAGEIPAEFAEIYEKVKDEYDELQEKLRKELQESNSKDE